MKIFIIHGALGSPEDNWFPYLKSELEKRWHRVFVLHFPAPPEHNLNNWLATFREYEKEVGADSVFVGHSLGCPFIVDWLAAKKKKIRAGLFVAPFYGNLGLKRFDSINTTFFYEINWNLIKRRIANRVCYISEDDSIVHTPLALGFAGKTGSEKVIFPHAGHFNQSAGYRTFPELLAKVLEFSHGTTLI